MPRIATSPHRWRAPLLLVGAALFLVPLVATPAMAQDPDTGDGTGTGVAESDDVVADDRDPSLVVADRLESATAEEPADTSIIPEIDVTIEGDDGSSTAQPLTIVLLLTVIALAPTLLLLLTSFTRIIIVLGLTRNALSLQGVPPNQVLIGLSLFLTIFVMAPVLSEANDEALQPLLEGEISQTEAFDAGLEPFRGFMLEQVRDDDLALFVNLADDEPASPEDVPTTTLIPAFILSELRAAFIIGFLIFVPFLVVDIVISATLMSMGMVMLPPVVISLPFKLLLFVVVDGWALLVPTLVESFGT